MPVEIRREWLVSRQVEAQAGKLLALRSALRWL
jgi:hypothetical protein